MKKVFYLFIFLMVVSFLCSNVFAGGPLATKYGIPVIHETSSFPITYTVDRGGLGLYFDNQQATALVDECFSKWENVTTAAIYFENDGYLPFDVNETNYSDYLWDYKDGINPVIFDYDGALIDVAYGIGASDSVLGFASINPSGSYLGEGVVVLNGKLAVVDGTPGVLKATIVHELGHFVGLDHCQINTRYAQNGILTDDRYVPTMFPFQTDNDTSVSELNPDDEAALTMLYPVDADSVYGRISGTVKRSDGSPVLGANVTAVMVGDEDMNRFSSVSDYYRQLNGEFKMYVLPGTYRIFIEPVNRAFTGGSSVGPYAETLLGASFKNPVAKEYYNGQDESANEVNLNSYVEITVAAGEEVSTVHFIAEEDASAMLWSIILEIFFWIIDLLIVGRVVTG